MNSFPDPRFPLPLAPPSPGDSRASARRGWATSATIAVAACVAVGVATTSFAYRGQGQIRRAAAEVEHDLRADVHTVKTKLTDAQTKVTSLTADVQQATTERDQARAVNAALEGRVADLSGKASTVEGNLQGLAELFPIDYTFQGVNLSGSYSLSGTVTDCSGFDSCTTDIEQTLSGDLTVVDNNGAVSAELDGHPLTGRGFDGTAWVFIDELIDPIYTCGTEATVANLELRLMVTEVSLVDRRDGTSSLAVSRVVGTARLTTPASANCPAGDETYTFVG